MHTYSHAIFTWALARYLDPEECHAGLWSAAGSTVPDVPTLVKAARLAWKRRDSISKEEFREEYYEALEYYKEPSGKLDLMVHSLVPVAALLVLYRTLEIKDRSLLYFLLGWAGHNLMDFPTHAEDARPPFWPLFKWRWKSPVSYWDRKFYALPCLLVEHGALLALALAFLQQSYRETVSD
jgi:hypothetical protein